MTSIQIVDRADPFGRSQPNPNRADGKYILRTGERSTWKRCRQKWHWSFVECLEPYVSANPLRFGWLVHEALAAWYIPGQTRGEHPAKVFDRMYYEMMERDSSSGFGQKDEDEAWIDALVLGVEMLTNYVDHYGNEEEWLEIISPEMAFQVDVPDKHGDYLTTYAGKIDAVYRDVNTGDVGLLEHKTAKAIQTNHLALDEQAGSYWAFAPYVLRHLGVLKPDEPLRHILYNTLRKGKKDDRPTNEFGHSLNKNGSVSKNQPSPLFDRTKVYRDRADRDNLIYRVRAEAWEINRARQGKVPIYKNPTRDCSWDCQFRDMCILHESDAPGWEDMKTEEFKKWSPYLDHTDNKGELIES